LDFNEPRGDWWQWHQWDYRVHANHLHLQTDNHASTSSPNYFTGWMLFLTPNQQRQSTEGNSDSISSQIKFKENGMIQCKNAQRTLKTHCFPA